MKSRVATITESTTRTYIRVIADFARYFDRSPDQLGADQVREYTAHLFRDLKLSDNTVNQRVGALRFFFRRVLKRPADGDDMPYPKKKIHLPVIWSPEEVACLIDAAPIPFYRTILMTLYGTGVRRAELAALKVSDIDTARMVLHVQDGKGGKDRDIVLSPRLLEELQQHSRRLRRESAVWLFPGGRWHTADYPVTDKVVWHACRETPQCQTGSLQVALSKTLRQRRATSSPTLILPERFRYSPRTFHYLGLYGFSVYFLASSNAPRVLSLVLRASRYS